MTWDERSLFRAVYISYGMRFEAEKIVNMELGPIVQLEYGKRLALDIDRMRYTPLDKIVLSLADGDTIDLSKTPERGTEWTRAHCRGTAS